MQYLARFFKPFITRWPSRWLQLAAMLVVAQSCGQSDSSSLLGPTVSPLDSAIVQLTPQQVTLASGDSNQFVAVEIVPDSGEVVADVVWTATGGTITSTGLFTAGATPGAYQVTAQVRGHSRWGTAPVIVATPLLTSLSLNPATVNLVEGATQQFAVAGSWSNGSTVAPAVTYSVTGGTMTPSGLYTAGSTPGTFRVIATQQGGTKADTSIVSITAPAAVLIQMVLAPAAVTLAPGGIGQFSVTGTWSDGSVTAPAVSYAATGGTITAGGVYTAGTTPGAYRVIASQQGGSKADTSAVTIAAAAPTLTKLTISPKTVSLAANGAQQFAVSGAWSDGSVTVPVATYSANGGTITASGGYTAGAIAGTFAVVATQQGGTRADTATVTVTAAPPTLTKLTISPKTVSLAANGAQQFAVSGIWSDGSVTVPVVTYSATGGTITANGAYTAGTSAGTFSVVATQLGGTKADSAAVTVTVAPPTLTKLTISPKSVSLAPGAAQQFTVSGAWSDGSTAVPVATYSATGGTITASGSYVAGASPGTFRVIAVQQGGTKSDTSTVSVLATPPAASSCSRTVNASTMTGLTTALSNSLPGDCILLSSGSYTLDSGLVISRSGSMSAPIVIQGQGSSTIIQVNQQSFFIDANYVQLRRMRITNFYTVGLWLRSVTGVVLDSVEVDHCLQEAVALKFGSHGNIVRNSLIHDTGIQTAQYGEAVYIGGMTQDGTERDFAATSNQVLNNHFGPNVRAEGVDVKSGADSTVVHGNYFDGTGAVFIDSATVSLISVAANYVTVDSNYLQYGNPNGVEFVLGTGTMVGNVATSNTMDLQNPHNFAGPIYGFEFQAGTVGGAVVKCNNVMISGALSNRPCTP